MEYRQKGLTGGYFEWSRVFIKVLSRWQKLWSRWRRNKLPPVQLASTKGARFLEESGGFPLGRFWNVGLLECISSIPGKHLECFKTDHRHHWIFLAFLFSNSTWILYIFCSFHLANSCESLVVSVSVLKIEKLRVAISGVPNEHFSQNWLYDVVNASKVLLRQPMLIFNFPGKKIPALHC